MQLLALMSAVALLACSQNATPDRQAPAKTVAEVKPPEAPTPIAKEKTAPTKVEPGKTTLFGAPLPTDLATIELSALVKNPEAYADKSVGVTGYVRKACTKKGCWMELSANADDKNQGVRISFQDYKFFVPLDSAGCSAKLSGVPSVKVVSKEHVDHLEAEGATFANKKEDGTAVEVQLVATGVELTR